MKDEEETRTERPDTSRVETNTNLEKDKQQDILQK